MARGSARSVTLESAYALAELIGGMAPNEALTLGRLRANLPDDVNVVRRHELTDTTTSDVIARTGEYLHFAPGEPAWMLLDHDSKGMPADVAIKLKDAGGFWPAVTAVIPGLAGPATVRRRSTSAGLYRSDIRERLPGSANQHIYVLASDGTDIERALKTLHERLWLAEVGYFVVGAAGHCWIAASSTLPCLDPSAWYSRVPPSLNRHWRKAGKRGHHNMLRVTPSIRR